MFINIFVSIACNCGNCHSAIAVVGAALQAIKFSIVKSEWKVMVHQQESDVRSSHGIMTEHGMLSKKITGAPFHGSMIKGLKEYSKFQGGLLTIF